MSIEDIMRERHAFEDRARTFLELVSVMTTREIEVALARLADVLMTESDEVARANTSIKGELLKKYHDMRQQGLKPQKRLKRVFYLPSDPQCCLPKPGVSASGKAESDEEYAIRSITEVILLRSKRVPPSTSEKFGSTEQMVREWG